MGTSILGGLTLFGNQSNPEVSNNYGINVDFTKTKRAHTMEFGGEANEYQYGTVGFQQQNPPRYLQLMGKIIF